MQLIQVTLKDFLVRIVLNDSEYFGVIRKQVRLRLKQVREVINVYDEKQRPQYTLSRVVRVTSPGPWELWKAAQLNCLSVTLQDNEVNATDKRVPTFHSQNKASHHPQVTPQVGTSSKTNMLQFCMGNVLTYVIKGAAKLQQITVKTKTESCTQLFSTTAVSRQDCTSPVASADPDVT